MYGTNSPYKLAVEMFERGIICLRYNYEIPVLQYMEFKLVLILTYFILGILFI
jgi:hypothetical protein